MADEKLDTMSTPFSTTADRQIDLLDLALVLAENARLLILGPLLAGVVALGITYLIAPRFTAETSILPPQQRPSSLGMLASQFSSLSDVTGVAGVSIKNPADLYVALLKSRTIADRLIDRFKLLQEYGTRFRQAARKQLASATAVRAGKDGLITIQVEDKDPKRAASIANAYVDELFRLNASLAITDAQQRRLFFENQRRAALESLKNAQAALSKAGVPEALVKSSPEAVVAGIARLQAQLTAQEIKLSTMRGYATEQSPEIQQAKRELDALRTRLASVQLNESPVDPREADYLNRFRDFKYQEALLEFMTKQYEAAKLDESREGTIIQVVDPAVPPERKSGPRRALIAILTTLAAGVLLMIFVVARAAVRGASSNPATASKLNRLATYLKRIV